MQRGIVHFIKYVAWIYCTRGSSFPPPIADSETPWPMKLNNQNLQKTRDHSARTFAHVETRYTRWQNVQEFWPAHAKINIDTLYIFPSVQHISKAEVLLLHEVCRGLIEFDDEDLVQKACPSGGVNGWWAGSMLTRCVGICMTMVTPAIRVQMWYPRLQQHETWTPTPRKYFFGNHWYYHAHQRLHTKSQPLAIPCEDVRLDGSIRGLNP